MTDVKTFARQKARARRAAADPTLTAHALERAADILPDQGIVAGYLGIGTELDPRPLLERLSISRSVALPLARADSPLTFRLWTPQTPLVTSAFGVPEPAEGDPVTPTILLVPLLAFDRAGGRLGYGGGHYDRTLAKLRAEGDVFAIGLAYAVQEVAACPRDRYDEPLDALVTERETIVFDGRTRP